MAMRVPLRRTRRLPSAATMAVMVVLAGVVAACGSARGLKHDPRIALRTDDFMVIQPRAGDSLESLAARYLGTASNAGIIARYNDVRAARPGQNLLIPLDAGDPVAIHPDRYQTVPVLSYHRFAPGNRSRDRLEISEREFDAQMAYLAREGYTVIGLPELADYMEGKRPLPPRSVVLTLDDGYESAYTVAYPILRKYRFPATIFVYTDFVGAGSGLKWSQMKEMVASGLIDIQPHSKSHSNLTRRLDGESKTDYLRRLNRELRVPADLLRKRLGVPIHSFAYPYGATDETLAKVTRREGYRLAVTVVRGGNPVFAHPFLVRRTMIYAGDGIDAFAKSLHLSRRAS